MDITNYQEQSDDISSTIRTTAIQILFPETPTLKSKLKPLLSTLSESNMRDNLVKFSSFYNRYARGPFGKQSSEWLLQKVNETANSTSGVITVSPFVHEWGQNSVIARIQGQSNKTVVIGAHQDSINQFGTSLRAPGADDDGSGSITILEAFRALLLDDDVRSGKAPNTVEFHWYSAEELGLWGSQAVFTAYQKEGRDVRAMLQQDMTG
jgi:bacterial leucyl aminopeptidase